MNTSSVNKGKKPRRPPRYPRKKPKLPSTDHPSYSAFISWNINNIDTDIPPLPKDYLDELISWLDKEEKSLKNTINELSNRGRSSLDSRHRKKQASISSQKSRLKSKKK